MSQLAWYFLQMRTRVWESLGICACGVWYGRHGHLSKSVIFALIDFRRKISKSNIKVMINFEIKYIIKTVRKYRKFYKLYVLIIFYTVTKHIIIDIKRYMYYLCLLVTHHPAHIQRRFSFVVHVTQKYRSLTIVLF